MLQLLLCNTVTLDKLFTRTAEYCQYTVSRKLLGARARMLRELEDFPRRCYLVGAKYMHAWTYTLTNSQLLFSLRSYTISRFPSQFFQSIQTFLVRSPSLLGMPSILAGFQRFQGDVPNTQYNHRTSNSLFLASSAQPEALIFVL